MAKKLGASRLYVISARALPAGEPIGMPEGKRSTLQSRGMAQGIAMGLEASAVGPVDDVIAQWSDMFSSVSELLSKSASRIAEEWRLEEIKIDLGVDAKGKLAFIAEASASASVSVTLKRKQGAHST